MAAIILEILIPLGLMGMFAWILWLRHQLKLRGVDESKRLRDEVEALRAAKEETEKRLEALETIAVLEDGPDRKEH